MLLNSILLGLVAAFGTFDYQMGTTYIFRPITLGPLVGLVLGDFTTGITVGASLELIFMGAVSVGAYIPPDVIIGGVLGTAYAITLGGGVEVAVAVAMPIALLSQALGAFLDTLAVFSLRWADNGAKNKDLGKIKLTHRFIGFLTVIRRFALVSLAYYFSADVMESVLNAIPEFIISGLEAGAGLLPAIGFAMLMQMIMKKELIPFYFIGFLLSAYLEIPILGIAIFGIVFVLIKYKVLEPTVATTSGNNYDEEDFDDEF